MLYCLQQYRPEGEAMAECELCGGSMEPDGEESRFIMCSEEPQNICSNCLRYMDTLFLQCFSMDDIEKVINYMSGSTDAEDQSAYDSITEFFDDITLSIRLKLPAGEIVSRKTLWQLYD
jgi:hypothetical protein